MVSSSLTDRSYRPSAGGRALDSAAEALWAAFEGVARPRAIVHCPHCVTTAECDALTGPVATLDPALVARFVRKAGTTWGDADDLRRIAPRALVLAAEHRLPISRRVLWDKLRWAGWTTWPTEQTDAIGRFLLAEFGRLLAQPPRPASVAHRWLDEVSAGIDDLSGFWTVWHDTMGPLPDPAVQHAAVDHLVELLTSSALRPDLPATVGDVLRRPVAAAQLTEFLVGPGTDHELRRAAGEAAGTRSSRRLGVAVERLRRFRAAVERGAEAPQVPDQAIG
ncbi:MAG: hypothetical protein KDA98_02620 [Acidimicrobiales bacterium]|nr:hypothetical protein [Acidimicrobiales bacterium]